MTDSTDNARRLGMTDMDRFIEAADALADAMIRIEDLTQHDMGMCAAEERVIHFEAQSALLIYRAAREAITRGTPPAFATSA